ncbi:platelet-activating factor receptor [Synchiropus picturatus]
MSATTESPASSNSTNLLDSEFRYQLLTVSYSIIFILGLFTNVYVLFVLRGLRGAKAMGEIRIYMTNLTVADLLFVCALPFWISYYHRDGHWIFGDLLCRLTGPQFFINTYCSILFLGVISVNRYWAVTRPLDAACSDHRRRGIFVSIIIWAVTIAMALPYLISPATNMDKQNITRCFEGYQNDDDGSKRKLLATHLAIIALFFVVFFLVLICNLLIARTLLTQSPIKTGLKASAGVTRKSVSAKSPTGVKRRALQMLIAVVGVFIVCFLPHHVVQGFWTAAVLQIKEGWGQVDWTDGTRQALNDAHQVTLVLMGLNCVLDPVVYCFATRKFRRFIVAHLKKLAKGERCTQAFTTELSVDSHNQSQRFNNERNEIE